MPLTSFPRLPVPQLDGVLFAMADGGRTVSVLVTHEALQDLTSPPLAAGSYEAQLDAHRARLEEIASDKFDRGEIESNGSVRITTSDISN